MEEPVQDSDSADPAKPSRAVTGWTVGLICVAIVAAGVIVGGLLHKPEPELTTEPVTPTTSVEPVEYTYVTPPVTFPVQIPGCDVVEPPEDGVGFSMVTVDDIRSYDNPAYPWFSGPKAVAMTQALREALPDDVEIAFASEDSSLLFQPIFGPPTESPEFGGSTTADATLQRGDRAGSLFVSVQRSTTPIPPCEAGDLDERRHLGDGTIVDTQDTWSETNGVRTLSRTATAYLPDGTVAYASANDAVDVEATTNHTRAIPLTIDDLVALVTAPGLLITAPVPPGTPNPPESCGTSVDSVPAIDQATARRLDAVLARIPLDGRTVDRPLGALRPTGTHGLFYPVGKGGVCQTVRITTPGQQSQLTIMISTGQPVPKSDTSSDNGVERVTVRRLPDGSVVENRESRSTMVEPTSGTSRFVTVTRPSGSQVEITSAADVRAEPLPFELLEAIALTPGLEVS